MNDSSNRLMVYYDGSCRSCVRDRQWYEKLAGRGARDVAWLDITGRDALLHERGIDPDEALMELHVEDAEGRVHRELDAYVLLMSRVPWLKPLAWFLRLPGIRSLFSSLYQRWVRDRLASEGRLPGTGKRSSQ